MKKTRGELEAEFTREIIKFEKDYFGRGPLDARTYFINDMILVRVRGELTLAEKTLSESREGQELVKNSRRKLIESSRKVIEDIIKKVVECDLVSLHSDISTKTGERIIVLTVDTNLTEKFR